MTPGAPERGRARGCSCPMRGLVRRVSAGLRITRVGVGLVVKEFAKSVPEVKRMSSCWNRGGNREPLRLGLGLAGFGVSPMEGPCPFGSSSGGS